MVRQPDALQHRFVELAFDLCRAGSAGISMLEEGERGEPLFRWTALAGEFAPYISGRATSSRQKSGSHRTPRWRELDSNPWSPVTRHPNLDVPQRAAVFFAFSRGRFSGVA